MGSSKGSADSSGMYAAMASAQAADQLYQLGEQQFQWSKQVWEQEQPLYNAAEQAQIDLATQQVKSLSQMQAEAQQQWQTYVDTYLPLEQQYASQAQNWASPEAMAMERGKAMSDIAEHGQAGINTAAEQLRAYGVDPGSKKYASLFTSTQPMLGAAEAAAGTTASENLRLQQMGLEAGAINTGRGMVNATGQLTQAGTGAGAAGAGAAAGAGQTAASNLAGTAVGAGATSQLANAGSNAMNTYVNAVNGYNQAQAEFAQAGASEMSGFGSALGSMLGLGFGRLSDEERKTDITREGTDPRTGIPLYSYRYKEDPKSYPKVVGPMAQDVEKVAPHLVRAIPGSPGTKMIALEAGGPAPAGGALPGPTGYQQGGWAGDMDQWGGGGGGSFNPRAFLTQFGGDINNARQQFMQQFPNGPPSGAGAGDWHNMFSTLRGDFNKPFGSSGGQWRGVTPGQWNGPTPGQWGSGAGWGGGAGWSGVGARHEMGGSVGYDDGGDVYGSDPQLTPNQGGGQTGIPSQPLPPAETPPGDATPGGGVPAYASPSMGVQTDDVPAMLTANEFVIPKDVAVWKGHEYFAKQIDAARRAQQQFSQRDDIGGEPTNAPPQQPTFISRPQNMGTTMGAIPGMPA